MHRISTVNIAYIPHIIIYTVSLALFCFGWFFSSWFLLNAMKTCLLLQLCCSHCFLLFSRFVFLFLLFPCVCEHTRKKNVFDFWAMFFDQYIMYYLDEKTKCVDFFFERTAFRCVNNYTGVVFLWNIYHFIRWWWSVFGYRKLKVPKLTMKWRNAFIFSLSEAVWIKDSFALDT